MELRVALEGEKEGGKRHMGKTQWRQAVGVVEALTLRIPGGPVLSGNCRVRRNGKQG